MADLSSCMIAPLPPPSQPERIFSVWVCHHERLVIAAHAIGGIDRGCSFQGPCVLWYPANGSHATQPARPARSVGEASSSYRSPRLCGMLRAKPADSSTHGGWCASARRYRSRHPSRPSGCPPWSFKQMPPAAPMPPQHLRQLLATHGSPPQNTQTRLRTQIISFRHSRLQNLRQGRCVFFVGDAQNWASTTRHAREKPVSHDASGIRPFSLWRFRNRNTLVFNGADRFEDCLEVLPFVGGEGPGTFSHTINLGYFPSVAHLISFYDSVLPGRTGRTAARQAPPACRPPTYRCRASRR